MGKRGPGPCLFITGVDWICLMCAINSSFERNGGESPLVIFFFFTLFYLIFFLIKKKPPLRCWLAFLQSRGKKKEFFLNFFDREPESSGLGKGGVSASSVGFRKNEKNPPPASPRSTLLLFLIF